MHNSVSGQELGTGVKVLNVFCLLGHLEVREVKELGTSELDNKRGFHS